MYLIDETRCTGCAACMNICPTGAIYLVNHKANINDDLCTDCGKCQEVCSAQAIRFESAKVQQIQVIEQPSLSRSLFSALKSTVKAVGSVLAPILISKLGDILSSKLDNSPRVPSSNKQSFAKTGGGGGRQRRNRGRRR
ncbi:4Fe-4S binding protein [candidate division KSB1 bacterium]|nr:4Fe-4S binding protein [candidate division KSB1 bacterium]